MSGLMGPLALGALVLASAIGVVQVKHRTRLLHNDGNRLTAEREQLDVEWAQLQLEEAAHSSHARIETKARKGQMIEPHQPVNVSAIGSIAAPLVPARAAQADASADGAREPQPAAAARAEAAR